MLIFLQVDGGLEMNEDSGERSFDSLLPNSRHNHVNQGPRTLKNRNNGSFATKGL